MCKYKEYVAMTKKIMCMAMLYFYTYLFYLNTILVKIVVVKKN